MAQIQQIRAAAEAGNPDSMKIAVKPSAIKTPVNENIQQPIVAVKQPAEQPVAAPQPQEGQGLRIRHNNPAPQANKKQSGDQSHNKKRRPRNRGKANSNNGSNRPADKHTVNEIRFH